MVGFNTNPESSYEPICLEPEKIHYPITDFDNLQELANEINSSHERPNMFLHTGEGVQEEMDQRLSEETFRLALERRLKTSRAKNSDRVCFVASSSA